MFHAIKLNTTIPAMALLAALAGGCEDHKADSHAELFASDAEVRDTTRVMNTQIARGARADATLYPCHFDGDALNSLGAAKLDLMLQDDAAAAPMTVWLATPEDESAGARRNAVAAYLKDHGLLAAQINFGHGANPDTFHPASAGVQGLAKIDSDTAGGAGASTGGSMSSTGGK